MKKVLCQLSPFFTRRSTGRPVYEPSSDLSQKRKSSRDLENERIRVLLERQKEQVLAEVRSEIQKHELQAESDRRSIQELTGIIEYQRSEVDHTIASDGQIRQEQLSEQNCHEMEELQRVQELRIDEFSRRKLIEDRETILELTARIQELQNEVNCMNDSRDF